MAAFLADVIVFVHFCIVSFCVAGEVAILIGAALKWVWIRNLTFRIIHLSLILCSRRSYPRGLLSAY
jgi:hypothetical protein